MATLKEGDKAPGFTAKDQNGKTVSLADFKGKTIILYFYPKDAVPITFMRLISSSASTGLLIDISFNILEYFEYFFTV